MISDLSVPVERLAPHMLDVHFEDDLYATTSADLRVVLIPSHLVIAMADQLVRVSSDPEMGDWRWSDPTYNGLQFIEVMHNRFYITLALFDQPDAISVLRLFDSML